VFAAETAAPQENNDMFIGPLASGIWSAATTALTSPNSATVPVGLSPGSPNSPKKPMAGHHHPFQGLSSDLQAWVLRSQSANGNVPGGSK
jgi:hypothetical protein